MAQDYMAALLALSNDTTWAEARLKLFETMGQQGMSEVAQRYLRDGVSAEVLGQITPALLDDRARRLQGAAAIAPITTKGPESQVESSQGERTVC